MFRDNHYVPEWYQKRFFPPGGKERKFPSLLLANGEDVVRVSRLLGHSSPKITLDVYSHALPTAHYGTAERLERLLNGNNLETETPIAAPKASAA